MNVYTVTELNLIIKKCLDGIPELNGAFVRGEISNCKQYPSGHWYFSLKDEGGAIRCVMFRREASSLKFRPENGMSVIAEGRVSVYPRDGQYQFYCSGMQPDGVGALHIAYEQLVKKLGEQGLFDKEHKKPLPRFPERVALVTSGAGAAVRDMIRILGKRFPLAKVIIMPVRVQGEQAASEIAAAIKYANRYSVADVIITGRGGGSLEDLWAFNEEPVARAIYESDIPVISAVGHEPDVTISDFTADVRASTPSNAAELAVTDTGEMISWLRGAAASIARAQTRTISSLRQVLGAVAARREFSSPMNYVQERRVALDHLSRGLTSGFDRCISDSRRRYTALAASLDALSPLKVLARGYSVVRTEDGSVVRDSSAVNAGENVMVSLSRGELRCSILETRHERK